MGKLTKVKLIEKTFGMKWKYDGVSSWWSEDYKSHISRVNVCGCDDFCTHPPGYYLYREGTYAKKVIFTKKEIICL